MIGTTSSTTIEEDGDIIRIPSVYDFQLDEYQGLNISIPHFTSLLEVLSKENIDIIQCFNTWPSRTCGSPSYEGHEPHSDWSVSY